MAGRVSTPFAITLQHLPSKRSNTLPGHVVLQLYSEKAVRGVRLALSVQRVKVSPQIVQAVARICESELTAEQQ